MANAIIKEAVHIDERAKQQEMSTSALLSAGIGSDGWKAPNDDEGSNDILSLFDRRMSSSGNSAISPPRDPIAKERQIAKEDLLDFPSRPLDSLPAFSSFNVPAVPTIQSARTPLHTAVSGVANGYGPGGTEVLEASSADSPPALLPSVMALGTEEGDSTDPAVSPPLPCYPLIDAAFSSVFQAGLDSVDWLRIVQDLYGMELEELLHQQGSLLGEDDLLVELEEVDSGKPWPSNVCCRARAEDGSTSRCEEDDVDGGVFIKLKRRHSIWQ